MSKDFIINSWQDIFYIITIGGIGITAVYWIFKVLLSIFIMFLLKRLGKISYLLYGREAYLENRVQGSNRSKRSIDGYMRNYFKDDNLSHLSSVIALWNDVFDFYRDYRSLLVILKSVKASPSFLQKIRNKNQKILYPYEYSEINKKEWVLDCIKWKNSELVFSNKNNELSVLKVTNESFFKVSKKGRLKKITPLTDKQLEACVVIGSIPKKTLTDLLLETTSLIKK